MNIILRYLDTCILRFHYFQKSKELFKRKTKEKRNFLSVSKLYVIFFFYFISIFLIYNCICQLTNCTIMGFFRYVISIWTKNMHVVLSIKVYLIEKRIQTCFQHHHHCIYHDHQKTTSTWYVSLSITYCNINSSVLTYCYTVLPSSDSDIH